MADIFVSYARKDSDHVIPIMEELHSSGYEYWMDKDGILSGDVWYEAIATAITECKVLLLFVSSASINSENVRKEVGFAFENKKKIIILRLEDVVVPTAMGIALTGINWTDAWDRDWKRKITAALRKDIQEPPRNVPLPVPIPKAEPSGKRSFTLDGSCAIKLILAGLLFGVVIAVPWFLLIRGKDSKTLWTFDQGTESWQPEKHNVKPEDVATQVSWNSSAKALQGEFDFSQVKPENLSINMEPRATYYINPVKNGDWSAFQTLNFDVSNTSGHDLKVTFSISIGGCWYEFGEYQPVPGGQKTSLQFDLKKEEYKTCNVPDRKDNPPVTFNAVWRFDIIFGTQEDPWDQVKGSVLISNIKLTDRIPDAK